MSDTAKMRLIELNTRHIEMLERELERLRAAAAEGKPQATRFAPLRERLVLLVVNGLIMIGMAWVGADNRVANADQGLAKEIAQVERDVADRRASELYDTAEGIFVAAAEQGCLVE